MQENHQCDKAGPSDDCLRITFAFGQPTQHEIIGRGQLIGNVSVEHEFTGNPSQADRDPRDTGLDQENAGVVLSVPVA